MAFLLYDYTGRQIWQSHISDYYDRNHLHELATHRDLQIFCGTVFNLPRPTSSEFIHRLRCLSGPALVSAQGGKQAVSRSMIYLIPI